MELLDDYQENDRIVQWEYKTVDATGDKVNVQAMLNTLGQDGWECYYVSPCLLDIVTDTVYWHYEFKRQHFPLRSTNYKHQVVTAFPDERG